MQFQVPNNRFVSPAIPRGIPAFSARISPLTSAQDAELRAYLYKTGFPYLKQVSKNIETHVATVLAQAAAVSNVKVMYSAYDEHCSVGTGKALPGSDFDSWTILIDGTDADRQRLLKNLVQRLDPELVEHHWSPLGHICLQSEVKEMMSHSFNSDYFSVVSTHPVAHRVTNVMAALRRQDKALVNTLDSPFLQEVMRSKFYQGITAYPNFKEVVNQLPPKLKYLAREPLSQNFFALTDPEKYLIVKILKLTNSDSEQSKELLLYSADNPNFSVLQSLLKKQILWYLPEQPDKLVAPWKPSHTEERLIEARYPERRQQMDQVIKAWRQSKTI
jgi:hypothetical protein